MIVRAVCGTLKRFFIPALGALLLTACTPSDFRKPGPLQKEDVYNNLFPQWVELCAVSQISKKPGYGANIAGGPGGHALLFLHGACLDPASPYPVLKSCPDGETGISMNSHFSNANWVGIPHRDFFYNGLLKPDEALTQTAYAATKQEAQKRNLYTAIRFQNWTAEGKPADVSDEQWKYEISIGTDYAVSFGRARYCARLPISQEQLKQIITFLNGRNALYQNGPKTFETNVLQDNCNHLTHNALAAADFWHELPVHQFILKAALTFPVPKNEIVNLLDQTQRHDIGDLHALYHDRLTRKSLLEKNWLPDTPGVILDSNPVKTPNEIYNTQLSLIFYDDPLLGHYHKAFDRYLNQPRYHDLKANLLWYQTLYAKIAAERRPLSWWLKKEPSGFSAFYNAYYVWLQNQQNLVQRGLTMLTENASLSTGSMPAQPGKAPVGPEPVNGP
ncbi:MAG: hypothetical protein ABF430_04720 [Acetobacter persici]|uniref:hypothetical protein n=1 Tax=Acetobacter persici TaxID=1076596 RepID=UPI0039E99A33